MKNKSGSSGYLYYKCWIISANFPKNKLISSKSIARNYEQDTT
ncbi:hypothetical protein E6C60_3661 [Paenibacillus algicola]|uniref:Uncharacterized protein n=1 Tax=Paenibacillus algicola TaxID=2565926 RepID=A0A4P8XUA0_9BACL|nr:hypothetical protein E6C60_3661 [Paenibacillus algicola]